jgi:tetratricopeptide (TPR) repeat protein
VAGPRSVGGDRHNGPVSGAGTPGLPYEDGLLYGDEERDADVRRLAELLRAGVNGGVVLAGVGGIGKTTLARRIVTRLREAEPGAVAVHAGPFNPEDLFTAIAAAIPDPPAQQLIAPGVLDYTKLETVRQLLHDRRLLLVFDDFEPNLTDGGGAFRNRAVADVFAAFCSAARRGKLLVTCRYPVPGASNLVTVAVPPLSRADVERMRRHLPGLRDLSDVDQQTIVDSIGGHPGLLTLVDALVRQTGQARLTGVITRDRGLAGVRDALVGHLVDLLTGTQRETLLQAAISRMPLPFADLRYAVNLDAGSDVNPDPADVDRLVDLTLLARDDRGLVVPAWIRDALDPYQGDDRPRRHDRAIALHRRRLDDGRVNSAQLAGAESASNSAQLAGAESASNFDDLIELVRHLTARQQFDELAYFPLSVCEETAGELGVAILLGDLLPSYPRDHPSIQALLLREIDALTNIGSNDAAAERDQELLAIMRGGAGPDDVRPEPDLGVALDQLGDLVQAPALATSARDLFSQATTLAVQMAQADPGDVWAMTSSYVTMGDLAASAGNIAGARDLYHQALTIARRLVEVDPGNVQRHRDLATYVGKLGLLEAAHGDRAVALQHFHEGQAIVAKLAAIDPSSAQRFREAFTQAIAELGGTP